jgi:RNA polymerase sigma-70 factor (ECF subfamily)
MRITLRLGMLGSTDSHTDEDIVAISLQRKEMFAVLVRRYEGRLSRYLRRLGVFRKEDIEDVLQNVFLKAYRNLNAFDQRLKFSSWIYRISHNEAVSFFRARSVRPEGVLVADGEDLLEQIPGLLDVESATDRRIDGEALVQALYGLDAKHREILILRYFEEREYAEISDILQIPVSSVGTLLARAKKKLRARYPPNL